MVQFAFSFMCLTPIYRLVFWLMDGEWIEFSLSKFHLLRFLKLHDDLLIPPPPYMIFDIDTAWKGLNYLLNNSLDFIVNTIFGSFVELPIELSLGSLLLILAPILNRLFLIDENENYL
jgi:hypothetical protein